MKFLVTISSFLMVLTLCTSKLYAQDTNDFIITDNIPAFLQQLQTAKQSTFSLQLAKHNALTIKVNRINNSEQPELEILGNLLNEPQSTFTLTALNNQVAGNLIITKTKEAYELYTTKDGVLRATKTSIDKILCVDFEAITTKNDDKGTTFSKMAPQLESLPGAPGIIYLDFDGELVTGTSWLGGATIDAQSPNFSDQKIIEVWKIMAEDFRPFNLNVTTNRALYDAAPSNRRMMCIFTPTKDAAPNSGGVAYIGSFASNRDNPCWVYNLSTRAAGETGSHEIGHTLRLLHDGKGETTYYSGHADWSPIMGWSASKPIGHWSLGEYTGATNDEDDVAIIAANPGVGFQNDDHADTYENATPILVDGNGNVSASQNFGLISQRTDKDYFSFTIETGEVQFSINPDPDYPNLKIQAVVLNAIGETVTTSTESGMGATINTQLTEGNYYLEIDGIGDGSNPSTGYSDYSSLGNYSISGSYIPGDNLQPPVVNFEASTDCNIVSFRSTTANTVNTYLWDFGDGTTSNVSDPVHTYNQSGTYTVSLTATNTVGSDSRQKANFITITLPSQPVGEDQNICAGESLELNVSGSDAYRWYTVAQGGTSMASGASFETPQLTTTTTYYVEGVAGDCVTANRTAVTVVVDELPQQPVVTINDGRFLTADGAYDSYQWYLDDEPIIGATAQRHLPEAVGNYSVEVFNESDCTNISESFAVDLSQLNASQGSSIFVFYPNPTTNDLHIDGLSQKDINLRIVNTYGQIVYEDVPNATVPVEGLNRGLYILLINNKIVGKFIKQ
ncbi:PKD domain-containing protein [Aquimarina brevivitae]|uniref:Putative secreted protein (Por secretion system target) n=1 Tax=Aquimarina brevivitae TaxID=323412 RepID=A0A4Q7P266_9FLAO|nr:PKD domain-containing protein [Aquimarina brevivitae]RZS93976.1 putative secreted protein (Por secretion system target) [Aquimarina brevivitae]